MAAGPLRERVTFQSRAAGSDGAGNERAGWEAITGATGVAARLKPVRQSETALAEGVSGRAAYEVTVRHTSAAAGLRTGDRMIDARDGRTFAIKGPPLNLDERGRFIRVLVEQGGADG